MSRAATATPDMGHATPRCTPCASPALPGSTGTARSGGPRTPCVRPSRERAARPVQSRGERRTGPLARKPPVAGEANAPRDSLRQFRRIATPSMITFLPEELTLIVRVPVWAAEKVATLMSFLLTVVSEWRLIVLSRVEPQ
jgi:hypothetical protein